MSQAAQAPPDGVPISTAADLAGARGATPTVQMAPIDDAPNPDRMDRDRLEPQSCCSEWHFGSATAVFVARLKSTQQGESYA